MIKKPLFSILISLVLILFSAVSCNFTFPNFLATVAITTSDAVTIGEATVVKVVDGDTIDVKIGGIIHRVRYIGIDTPETVAPNQTVEPFGPEASAKNKELVAGKVVRLEKDVSETDKYDRLLRYVYIGDLFVNAELVRLGYAQAVAYPPDTKYQSLLVSMENEAKAAHRGMWVGKYIGSKLSNKYHLPSCSWAVKITSDNAIWFYSVADAKVQGYIPCGVCQPPETD